MSRTTTPIEEAAAILGPLARRSVPVGLLTTYRVGGRAALLATVESAADLQLVSRAVQETGVPTVVLGRGSNTLVADRGYPGLVVVLGGFAAAIAVTGTTAEVGAGVLLPVLARRTAAAGLTGAEWMVGIPGSVGGADSHGCLRASDPDMIALFARDFAPLAWWDDLEGGRPVVLVNQGTVATDPGDLIVPALRADGERHDQTRRPCSSFALRAFF
jgi:hypothetical protein